MKKHQYGDDLFCEGDFVQCFLDDAWVNTVLQYDGFCGWYVRVDDSEIIINNWKGIRRNPFLKAEGLKRIKIGNYGTAKVSVNCSEEVIKALEQIAKLAYENAENLILKVDSN